MSIVGSHVFPSFERVDALQAVLADAKQMCLRGADQVAGAHVGDAVQANIRRLAPFRP
jgi:hypothetical protein